MTYYSIVSKGSSNNKGYGVKVIKEKVINNISDDLSVMELLVNTCNRLSVDYEHFEDILENFIDDYKTFWIFLLKDLFYDTIIWVIVWYVTYVPETATQSEQKVTAKAFALWEPFPK